MPSAQVTQSAQVTEIPSAQVTARPPKAFKALLKSESVLQNGLRPLRAVCFYAQMITAGMFHHQAAQQ